MSLSEETRKLLLGLLDQVSLSGQSPTLVDDAQRVAEARRELLADAEENVDA